jgi:hypothetical protein
MKSLKIVHKSTNFILTTQRANYAFWDNFNTFTRLKKATAGVKSLSQRIDETKSKLGSKTDKIAITDKKLADTRQALRRDLYPEGSNFPKLNVLDLDGNPFILDPSEKINLFFFAYSEMGSEQAVDWMKKVQMVHPETHFTICYAYKDNFMMKTFQNQILKQLKRDTKSIEADLICACFTKLPFVFERQHCAVFLTDRTGNIMFQTLGGVDPNEFTELMTICDKL